MNRVVKHPKQLSSDVDEDSAAPSTAPLLSKEEAAPIIVQRDSDYDVVDANANAEDKGIQIQAVENIVYFYQVVLNQKRE